MDKRQSESKRFISPWMGRSMTSPHISVLMPVHNGEKYLKEAIDSVLAQTFTDFELIISNDGSNDGSKAIIESYQDPRIHYIENSIASGLKGVRNQGLAAVRGSFVAIIDCDDIWYPQRLEKQIEFLERHPTYSMVGSRASFLDEKGKVKGVAWRYDLPPKSIPPFLLFGNYFIHSSILLRRSMIPKEGYQTSTAEDYELWIRMCQNGLVWSLPEVLVKYRVHSDGDTYKQAVLANRTQEQILKLHLKQIERLGIQPTSEELSIHQAIHSKKINSLEQLDKCRDWLLKITNRNQIEKIYNQKSLIKVVVERWLICCFCARSFGLFRVVRIYFSMNLSKKTLFFSSFQYLRSFLRYIKNKDLGKIE